MSILALPLNAGDPACTTAGLTVPSTTNNAPGLSGRILSLWANDGNNGFATIFSSMPVAMQNLLKAQCFEFAQAIVQQINVDTPGWTNATLLNSWTTNAPGGGGNATLAYRKDILGQVWLKGNVLAPAGGSSSNVMQFPAGFRPAETRQWTAASYTGAQAQVNCQVTAGGFVQPFSVVGAGNQLNLEFSFLAEQ